MRDWRNKIILSGDKARSESFIGPAQSQMETLKREMASRGLSQGVRRVWLHDDVYVECAVCFNQMFCRIWTPPPIPEIPEDLSTEETYLLLVTGDQTRKITLSNISGEFEPGEAVECGADGYGTIDSIEGSILYGTFVRCYFGTIRGLTSNATGTITSCYRRHFSDKYEHRELNESIVGEVESGYDIFSALDNSPASDLGCGDLTKAIRREWTKVYDEFTLGAFTYVELTGLSIEQWGAVASFQGEPVTWEGNTWYGPFVREVRRNVHEVITGQGIDTHIGWDVWKDGDDYYCGLIGDMEETLHIFKLDQDNLSMVEVETFVSTVKQDQFYDEGFPDYHQKYTRLLGYGYLQEAGQHVAYWGQIGRDNPVYYEEILNEEDAVTEHDMTDEASASPGDIFGALWNPVRKELYLAFESQEGPGTFVVTEVELSIDHTRISWNNPAAGTGCIFYDGELISSGGGADCSSIIGSASDCLISVNALGETWYFETFCQTRPAGLSYMYSFTTIHYCTRRVLAEKEYLGKMLVHEDVYGKGARALFTCTPGRAQWTNWDSSGCCIEAGGSQAFVASSTGGYSECRPYGAKMYEFNKWIWSICPGKHTYSLSVDRQTTEEDGDNIVCVWPGDWEQIEAGVTNILKAASGWPYDYGWTSILLSGEDRSGNNWGGSVIYKDLEGDEGFFMVDHNGAHHAIGEFDRAFFTVHTEDEVING